MKKTIIGLTVILMIGFTKHTTELQGTYTQIKNKDNSTLSYDFYIKISNKELKTDSIDAVYINADAMPFSIESINDTTLIHISYNQKSFDSFNSINGVDLYTVNKEVLMHHQFYPAWVAIKTPTEIKKITINHFTEQQKKHKK